MTKSYDILVIGSGPAGCTAALYAARASLNVAMVAGDQPGGQLTITTDVENYPGFADAIQGPWLMEQMHQQIKNVGCNFINDQIIELRNRASPFELVGQSGNVYEARSIIIATGAQAKWLGLDSEKKFQGYGVSGCATCDGFFFKNEEVMVVGGGNTAVEEALFLTNHAKKVYLLHRRDKLKAEKVLQERLFKNKKIEPIWNHVLDEVVGTENPLAVTSARIKSTIDSKISAIKVTGIFIAIGHKPNTELFKNMIDIDNEGYIITIGGSTKTNIPGIFASGDVQDKIYRQAVTAAGTGCMAALDAVKFLEE
jgi:thioredoxin reductase (NADPH)